jgi:glucokinase
MQAPRTSEAAVERTAVGIDFGGTKIEVALADGRGTLLERVRMDTRAEQGPDQVLERAVSAARQLERRSLQAHGMEVGAYAAVSPGVIQSDRILLTPNLPGWERIALARRSVRWRRRSPTSGCSSIRNGSLSAAA